MSAEITDKVTYNDHAPVLAPAPILAPAPVNDPINDPKGNTMRIHTDENNVYANALETDLHGENVKGHDYQIVAGVKFLNISFQKGAVKEAGVNGITSEALLAVLIHRTKALNDLFPCDENARAINHLEDALANFNTRTLNRQRRGVEGYAKA